MALYQPVLTKGLVSTERMGAAANCVWTAVVGQIEPAPEPPLNR
jgi:hypothetical protein